MVDQPYFPPIRGGSNAIGEFKIGTSPIGTISAFVWQDTVISQYANSPRILKLLENLSACLNPQANLDSFFDFMFNIMTAKGYGLDVWGRIVGVVRTLTVANGTYFGFEEAADLTEGGWGQEVWYLAPATNNFALTDDAYRLLILAKAMANISDGSIPAINALLMALFPNRGNTYTLDGVGTDDTYFGFAEAGPGQTEGWNQAVWYNGALIHTMAMRYVFNFPLSPVETAIVTQSGVLPTPAGVKAYIVINS